MKIRLCWTAALLVLTLCAGTAPVHAAFPGQNGRIAFTRDPGSKYLDLWSSGSNGADEDRLTDDPLTEFEAAESPTSRKIVYSALFADNDSYEICELMKSGDCNRLTDSVPWDRAPAFSPTGEKIVWVRDGELYKMNADGSHERQLVDLPGTESGPVWSPSGRRIAFSRQLPSSQSDIFTIKPNGEKLKRVTNSSVDDSDPDWHPTRNVLIWTRDDPSTFDDQEIVRKSLAPGSSLRFLTNSPIGEGDPAYAPNGTKIAYTRFNTESDSPDIYVMNANGGDKHVIVDSLLREFQPYWLLRAD